MFERIYLIAIIPKDASSYTVYFIEKKRQIILPVIIDNQTTKYFLDKDKKQEDKPVIYDTVKRIILSLNASLISINIYKYKKNFFYTYINLANNDGLLEINSKFDDAFILSKYFNAGIYIKHEILVECGIKVTKNMLKEALDLY